MRDISKFNVPLAKYTSYKVGGSAKIYFKPENLQQLVEFIKELPKEEEIFWLGLGSNVLIRDGGIDGVVIHTHNVLNTVEVVEQNSNGLLVKVGAGLSCAQLAKFCVKNNLAEGIWFAGIPGTIGGALAMNAGAFGGETWRHVIGVEVINRQGEILQRSKDDYKISYRSVINVKNFNEKPNEWFIAGLLFFLFNNRATNDFQNELQEQINLLLKKRKTTQPIGTLNCGSVFKNPTNNFAAKLIESSQLKGKKLGDAIVSDKHANFIINLGTATAKDLEQLICLVQKEVFNRHNILLEPEVKIVGKPN
ncbi:MAG: UDP-N-acetylmuramate dehydrogenase [Gammaproteobacteria bacterium]